MAARTVKMPYVRLGNSGLKVSSIILGTQQYGHKGWAPWVVEEEEGIQRIKAAYDPGIQTFDTANVYSNGLSEIILGKAIKQLQLPREEIVIMIKLHFPRGPSHDTPSIVAMIMKPDEVGLVNQHGLSRKHIFDEVKACPKRLQLDYIDVLQCHRFDHETPIEGTMRALDDVVKAGYVRYIGMNSCHAYQFQQMQNYAITHNLTPFISMQNHYNLIYREEEREMFPTLKTLGVGAIDWSPFARGILTRPYNERSLRGDTDWYISVYKAGAGTKEVVDRVEEIAKKKGISMAQVAVAWMLRKDYITAPVVGPTKIDNLKDLVAGIYVTLTEDEIKYLEELYVPTAVIGHT